MGVGAGLCMYVVVVQKFTFAISSPDEFLWTMDTGSVYQALYPPTDRQTDRQRGDGRVHVETAVLVTGA